MFNDDFQNLGYELEKFEEAFTSENWKVRIYKVKDMGNRESIYINKNKKQENYPKNITEFK